MKIKLREKGTFVLVKWSDSCLYITEEYSNKMFEYSTIESIGAVVEHTKEKIVLCGDILDNSNIRRVS